MTIVDLIIIVLVILSVVVGAMRGIIREAVSIAALIIAIWASMRFGAYAGDWLGDSVGSPELRIWVGRFIIFIMVIAVGALAGWSISKIVRLAGLTGTDRTLGGIFGILRAVVFVGLFVLLARYAEFDDESWWHESRLLPYGETVADWIEVMAPRGMELLEPQEMLDKIQTGLPDSF
jgi:membrane protein required for colicin V production